MTAYIQEFLIDLINSLVTSITAWFGDCYWMCFMFENEIIGDDFSVNFDGIYTTIYNWAIVILIILFMKKIIMCYLAWQEGDPDSSPLVLVVNFVKAIIVMLLFGQFYQLMTVIVYEGYEAIMSAISSSSNTDLGVISEQIGVGASYGFTEILAFLFALCCLVAVYFQLMMRGVEILVIRLIMPFASLSLLNTDAQAFNSVFKTLLQNFATVLIQIALVKLTTLVVVAGHPIYAIAIAMVALRTPQFLSQFLITRQGASVSQRVGQGMGAVATAVHVFR